MVFNQFDIWKTFHDNININELSDYTLYYVEVAEGNPLLSTKFRSIMLFFNKKYNLIYGKLLKQITDTRILKNKKVLYYKTPSQVHNVDYEELFNELKGMTISDIEEEDKYLKKLIVNVLIGLLEKGGATDQKSLVFRNLAEAINYQSEYGGKLHKLIHVEQNEEGYERVKQKSYILNLSDKAKLKNGFRYIKELLLQQHKMTMNEAYYKLRDNGIYIHSVKTDAFVIDTSDVEKAQDLLNFHNDIGGWRVSISDDDIILPTTIYDIVQNEKVEIPTYQHKDIEIKNEYDTDNIIEVIKENNPMMIRGVFPGTGKSYICQKMVDKGFRVMFVCPTNRLLQEFEGDALTLNKFFGISFGDVKLEPFDYSGYDAIVFDEIYFSSLSTYWRIKQFVEENKNKKIILATGDTKQLKPIQPLTNIQEYEVYADHIINNIFTNSILLKECKRLKTKEDLKKKKKLQNVKTDILVNKLPFKIGIEKIFQIYH